jgi:hypothetical protein
VSVDRGAASVDGGLASVRPGRVRAITTVAVIADARRLARGSCAGSPNGCCAGLEWKVALAVSGTADGSLRARVEEELVQVAKCLVPHRLRVELD